MSWIKRWEKYNHWELRVDLYLSKFFFIRITSTPSPSSSSSSSKDWMKPDFDWWPRCREFTKNRNSIPIKKKSKKKSSTQDLRSLKLWIMDGQELWEEPIEWSLELNQTEFKKHSLELYLHSHPKPIIYLHRSRVKQSSHVISPSKIQVLSVEIKIKLIAFFLPSDHHYSPLLSSAIIIFSNLQSWVILNHTLWSPLHLLSPHHHFKNQTHSSPHQSPSTTSSHFTIQDFL